MFEEHLQTDADAEKRLVFRRVEHGRTQSARVELAHAAHEHRFDRLLDYAGLAKPRERPPLADQRALLLDPRGVEILGSVKGIPIAGWFAVTTLPTSEAFAPIHEMLLHMLTGTLALSIFATALAWWLVRRQLAPAFSAMRTLTTMARNPAPLQALQAEPFLALPPPKSTGRDLFHPQWLQQRLHAAPAANPADVQATLAELTASACAASAKSYGNESKLLIVCGGGAHNGHLMRRLSALLPGWAVESSAQHGLPPLQVEAAAFAWLAQRCMNGLPGNLPRVTGAAGPRILGAIYPA